MNAGLRLYAEHNGYWSWVRLLEQARVTPLDSSRYQVEWDAPDGRPLRYVMRTQAGNGPLALLALRRFTLPEQVFLIQNTGAGL